MKRKKKHLINDGIIPIEGRIPEFAKTINDYQWEAMVADGSVKAVYELSDDDGEIAHIRVMADSDLVHWTCYPPERYWVDGKPPTGFARSLESAQAVVNEILLSTVYFADSEV
ncbi:MAG: hypothetical protein ACYCUV_12755 [Phycisphaerae bacterium]